ncbi:hypothetical protein FVE85_2371 [Porphyridium purpureum]|uniref:Uncharacterized protein n=1 Tax=Porphyridium purpureum TaxID=35688 RepID=A0A5J4YXY2_PORPP|nr:hypothetical protein FVE85_2371 [Porphyridium purpureum]|eukprot:POR3823..scf209_3
MAESAAEAVGTAKSPVVQPPGSSLQAALVQRARSFDVRKLERTFFCVGPVCLRSGIGLGIGVGCGAGIGSGWAPFVVGAASDSIGGVSEGFSLPFNVIGQVPGGYQLVNLVKQVMRKFPGSKTGAGCGFGAGYGIGIGLQYGSSRGGSGGRFGGGGGMMSGANVGMGHQMNHMQGGMTMQGQNQYDYSRQKEVPMPMQTPASRDDRRLLDRIDALERRMESLDERLALSNRVNELERKLMSLDAAGSKRR